MEDNLALRRKIRFECIWINSLAETWAYRQIKHDRPTNGLCIGSNEKTAPQETEKNLNDLIDLVCEDLLYSIDQPLNRRYCLY